MTNQAIRPAHPQKQAEAIRPDEWILVESLWGQLNAQQQTQLAQQLANLIQRMRMTVHQEKTSHERA